MAITLKDSIREDKMKNMKSIGLIVLMLALSSNAMALQLSGAPGRAILDDVANNTFNQTLNATEIAPGNVGETIGGAVLEKVANILNQTFNATDIAPENLSEPSGGAFLENVTDILNQTFNATDIAPENLSEPSGGAFLEKAANDTRSQTAAAHPAASSGACKVPPHKDSTRLTHSILS